MLLPNYFNVGDIVNKPYFKKQWSVQSLGNWDWLQVWRTHHLFRCEQLASLQ